MNAIYTIGHSNHSAQYLLELLTSHGISAIADVRSWPVSRFAPHFSQADLKPTLEEFGIAYVFLGLELGARSRNPACYRGGVAQYDLLELEPAFASGLGRLRLGMRRFRIALLCAEKDPLECHRALLVGRNLAASGVQVEHILADGELEAHAELETRLLARHRLPETDLFTARPEALAVAYRLQSAAIAHTDELHADNAPEQEAVT